MNLQNGRPHHHFGCLVKNIEKMFETGKPPYPVERTMLTSGILDFALESRFQGYKKLETPQLAQVRYQTPDASHFCTRVGDRTANAWINYAELKSRLYAHTHHRWSSSRDGIRRNRTNAPIRSGDRRSDARVQFVQSRPRQSLRTSKGCGEPPT